MKHINILGFGTMGRHLAAFFYVLGYKVSIWNRTFPSDKMKKFLVEKRIFEKKFGLSAQAHNLSFVTNLSELTECLTIEVLKEDLLVKRSVLSDIPFDISCGNFFTNSSSYDPGEIHQNIEALHFFNPLYIVPLVETTSDNLTDQLFQDIENVGVTVLRVKNNRGFVGNYILFREVAAALNLIELYDYDAETIDTALSVLGRTSSLIEVVDIVGLDVVKKILENLKSQDPTIPVPRLLADAINAGILGKKNKTSIREFIKASHRDLP